MLRLPVLLLMTLSLAVASCDWTDVRPVEEQVVVEAYLLAGQSLAPVRLTRTVPVDALYDPEAQGVDDAQVVVSRLTDDGSVDRRYEYENRPGNGGLYVSPRGPMPDFVVPGATYRLDVTLAEGAQLTATTVVPDTMSVVAVSRDTVPYEGERVEITLTRSAYPGRQAYLVFTAESLEASLENATDVTRRLLEENDDLSIDEMRVTSSIAISEATYVSDSSEPLVIPVPWIGIRFYGRQRIQVSAVDDNLYDFMRSQLVQQGGSTFLPGEVPNILDHIDGGTGVFASYASVQVLITVLPPEEGP